MSPSSNYIKELNNRAYLIYEKNKRPWSKFPDRIALDALMDIVKEESLQVLDATEDYTKYINQHGEIFHCSINGTKTTFQPDSFIGMGFCIEEPLDVENIWTESPPS